MWVHTHRVAIDLVNAVPSNRGSSCYLNNGAFPELGCIECISQSKRLCVYINGTRREMLIAIESIVPTSATVSSACCEDLLASREAVRRHRQR
jgi:hypothetical protein